MRIDSPRPLSSVIGQSMPTSTSSVWYPASHTPSSSESSESSKPMRYSNQLYPLKGGRYSSKGKWKRLSQRRHEENKEEPLPSFIRIFSWNVDFMAQNPEKRMKAALKYIQNVVFGCKGGDRPEPCCILLQEVSIRNFDVILNHPWIKNHFILAPLSTEKWPHNSTYGCVTLVSNEFHVESVSSLWFGCSEMCRNALMVDLTVSVPGDDSREVTFRVANTHLESLPQGSAARPVQLALISRMLKERGLYGGVVGGDMNAIGPSDESLVKDVGLCDAWTRGDDDETGYSWGYQGGGDFPPGRLDKILFTPGGGFEVDEPKIMAVDVKAADGQYISDHYALLTTLDILPE